jgi:hypothetical protein
MKKITRNYKTEATEALSESMRLHLKGMELRQKEQDAFDALTLAINSGKGKKAIQTALQVYDLWRRAGQGIAQSLNTVQSSYAVYSRSDVQQGKAMLGTVLETWVQKMLKGVDVDDLDDDEARLFAMLMTTDRTTGKLLSYEAIGETEGCSAMAIKRRTDKLKAAHKAVSCFIDKHAPRLERGKRYKNPDKQKK